MTSTRANLTRYAVGVGSLTKTAMSKLRIDLLARKFEHGRRELLENMSRAAVYHSKVEAFDKEAWDGDKWARRKGKDDGRRMLVKTGRMRASINILRRGKYSHVVGTRVPYAVHHNTGTSRLPKRQFIGMSRVLRFRLDRMISGYFRRVLQ
jgi:phage gpG-like protein